MNDLSGVSYREEFVCPALPLFARQTFCRTRLRAPVGMEQECIIDSTSHSTACLFASTLSILNPQPTIPC